MNKWINLTVDFMDNNKTLLLRRRLGADGVLSLLSLWIYCGISRIDGDLSNLSDSDIERAAKWDGEKGCLISHLDTIGFLNGNEWERKIHDWNDHNSWASKAKGRTEIAKNAGKASGKARCAK